MDTQWSFVFSQSATMMYLYLVYSIEKSLWLKIWWNCYLSIRSLLPA